MLKRRWGIKHLLENELLEIRQSAYRKKKEEEKKEEEGKQYRDSST